MCTCVRVARALVYVGVRTRVGGLLVQVEYEKKKKEEGKRARADKQQVLDMLFSAFEKHQYYNIKDLVDITKQPVVSELDLSHRPSHRRHTPHTTQTFFFLLLK